MRHQFTKASLLLSALILIAGCAGGSKKPVIEAPKVNPLKVAPILTPEHQASYDQALASFKAKDFESAQKKFEELLSIYPNLAGAQVNLGLIEETNDNLEAATSYYEQALQSNPSNIDALLQKGRLEIKSGKFKAAEISLLRAQSIDPDNAKAHFNLGVLYELYLQQYDDAISHYQRYVEVSNNSDVETVKRWIKLLERK